MTAEQLVWFLKGWITGKGGDAAIPPQHGEWQELVHMIMVADSPARGGCGCGGKRHG